MSAINGVTRAILLGLLAQFLVACESNLTVDQHLERARGFLEDAQYNSAGIELKNALRLDANSAEARFLLATIYLKHGQILDAEKEFRRAQDLGWPADEVIPGLAAAMLAQERYSEILQIDTDELSDRSAAEVLSTKAMAELSAGNLEAADELLQLALARDPKALETKLTRGRIAVERHKLPLAVQIADEVLAEDPGSAEAWRIKAQVMMRRNQLTDTEAAIHEAIIRSYATPGDLAMLALIHMQQNDREAAAIDAEELLAIAPGHPIGNFVQGYIHFQDKQYREAITALSLAESEAKRFPTILFYLSMAHLTQDNLEKAEALAGEFVFLAPENVSGRKLLAGLHIQTGQYDKAQRVLQPVLDYDPDDLGALNLMANAMLLDGKSDHGMLLYAHMLKVDPERKMMPLAMSNKALAEDKLPDSQPATTGAISEEDPNFPQTDILAILTHLIQEDYAAAIKAAESYKWRDLGSLSPYHVLGRVYLQAGEIEMAQETFNNALKRDSGDTTSNLQMAEIALQEGDVDTARSYYMQSLTADLNDLPTLLQLATLEARLGDKDKAIAYLEQAMGTHPDALEPRLRMANYFLDTGNPQRVDRLFDNMDVLQQRAPRVLELRTTALLAQGKKAAAREALEELSRSAPDSAQLRFLMAQIAESEGNFDEAEIRLKEALAIDDKHLPSLLGMAALSNVQGKQEAFRHYLDRLLAISPDSAEVLGLRAAWAKSQDDTAQAIQFARGAFEKRPDTRSVLDLATYLEAGGKKEEARKLLVDWAQDQPTDVATRLVLAGEMLADDDVSGANKQYESVLKLHPDNLVALNNLAWNLRTRNPNKALEYARRAILIAPAQADVLDTLAVVEYHSGLPQKAHQHINEALKHSPDNPAMLYHRAMIVAALGRKDEAAAQLRTLLADDSAQFPERREAEELLQSLSPAP